ncbi:MAG: T9SS type A sorting domain-containing protein [Vicingaceae bacterium]|nr:T9SS type A sorting domain-containing protein [Vicingaceae bacterium]
MKKLLLFIGVVFFVFCVKAQSSWVELYRNINLSPDNYQNLQGYVEVAPDNTIYLLESEAEINTFGGTVYLRLKAYDGSNWNQIGQDVLRNVENNESHVDFLITPSGDFYIGMKDTILKLNSTTLLWESTYVPEYYGGLSCDSNSNVYFIHRVQGNSGIIYSDLSLAKFINGSVNIETSIATNAQILPRKVNASNKIIYKNGEFYISLVTQSSNQIYVFKGNITNGFQKLEQGAPNNGSTLFVGLGLSSMAVDNSGNIFISHKPSTGNFLSIVQYDPINDNWTPFDTTGINSTFSGHNQLRFDQNDLLHLIYQGANNTGFLFKYNGQTWEHIGPISFWSYITINALTRPHLVFDNNNDLLFSTGFGTSSFPFQVFHTGTTVGISNSLKEAQVVMYPNPVEKTLNIKGLPNNSSIRIVDLFGKTVLYLKSLEDSYKTLDLSGLSNGIYLLQLEHNGAVITKKLVVSR